MAFDRFIVVSVDLKNNFGYARQLTSEIGMSLAPLVGFDTSRAAEMTFLDDESDEPGYTIPSDAVKQRQPQLDTVLVGSIAREIYGNHPVAVGTDGNPFLRNWAYADQYAAAKLGNNDVDFDDEPYDPRDDEQDEDDYVSTATVYSRAYAHTGNHELAREAAELIPGDWI